MSARCEFRRSGVRVKAGFLRASCLFLLLAGWCDVPAESWSRFRGPTGMGVSHSTGLPLSWSTDDNIAWKTALPGAGASSPIVQGDHVYVTAYSGYLVPGRPDGQQEGLKRHLLAVDKLSGEVVWDREVPAKLPEEERIRDHGFAANSPVADADRVYAFFGKTGVLAHDHQGNRLWQSSVGDGTSGWGTSASPILHGELLIINASVESESIVALDRRTGGRIWQADGIKEAWNTPLVIDAVSGRKELIVATVGRIRSFDPESGRALWQCDTDIAWYMVPSVVAHDGVVYCLGGRSGISALAVQSGGEGDVTTTRRLWTTIKGSNVSSPVLLDGLLFWAHDQRGVAFCARAASGEIVYEHRLEGAGQIYASALLADGRLYYTNRRGRTFVVAAKPEFEVLAVNDLGGGDKSQFNGSLAVDGNRLLLRSDHFLYCIAE